VERCLRALQRFRCDCSNPDVSARIRPPGLGCPFRVVVPSGIAATGLAIPLCRWGLPSAVWYSLIGLHWPQLSNTVKSTHRAWPAWEFYPITPSRPAAANQHLSWALSPYSTWRLEGPLHAGFCLARHVPPSGFGYPLDGLLPS